MYTVNLNISSRWPRTRGEKKCVPSLRQSLNSRSASICMYCQSKNIKQVAQNARRKKMRTDFASICEFSTRECMYVLSIETYQAGGPEHAANKNAPLTLRQSLNSRSASIRMYCQSKHIKQVAQNARRKKMSPHLTSISEFSIRECAYILSI